MDELFNNHSLIKALKEQNPNKIFIGKIQLAEDWNSGENIEKGCLWQRRL